jgi:hypothetical protein
MAKGITSYEKLSLGSPTSKTKPGCVCIYIYIYIFLVRSVCSSTHVLDNCEFIIIVSFRTSWLSVCAADANTKREGPRNTIGTERGVRSESYLTN